MKITFLGTNGPIPTRESGCSGYLVEGMNGEKIVVDLGCGNYPALSEHIRCTDITAVILTHLHFDHMADMLEMEYCLKFCGADRKIPVYVPDEPAHVRKCLECEWYDLKPHADITVGGITVKLQAAVHPVPGVSVRLEENGRSLVLTGDTNEHEGLTEFCGNCDVLVADAAFMEKDWKASAAHLSALRAGRLAANAHAGRLYLTHFFPQYDRQAVLREAQSAYPGAVNACAGMTVDV